MIQAAVNIQAGPCGCADDMPAGTVMTCLALCILIKLTNHTAILLLLFTGLTFLADDDFIVILDTLALVGFRLTNRADVCCDLTDFLLVDALNRDTVGSGNVESNAVAFFEFNRV